MTDEAVLDDVAFDANAPGRQPSVYVTRVPGHGVVDEGDWVFVDGSASHPFWSADGRFLYYLPTVPSVDMRGFIRARRMGLDSGGPQGDAFVVFSLRELLVPTFLSGTTPVATRTEIILILGDFRGDIWIRDLAG